jgi:hypothetical protein
MPPDGTLACTALLLLARVLRAAIPSPADQFPVTYHPIHSQKTGKACFVVARQIR